MSVEFSMVLADELVFLLCTAECGVIKFSLFSAVFISHCALCVRVYMLAYMNEQLSGTTFHNQSFPLHRNKHKSCKNAPVLLNESESIEGNLPA